MTLTEFYGLTTNPFEPTGAASGKYPFVPPANFQVLEEWVKKAFIEKKLYVMLVNSPHGAGKSTLMEELRKRAASGSYFSYQSPVILTKLTSLSIEELARDIIDEAARYTKPRYTRMLRGPRSPGLTILRKTLTETLMGVAQQSKLVLWIIDEFDILADHPKGEQQIFLQFLRGLIDDLAARDFPIALLMSHTKYSSRDFEQILEEAHGPFQSRIVASVPLGYTFDEVREIVEARMRYASPTPRKPSDIAPFTEDSLRTLFSLIISMRGSETLDYFRGFERCCHFALLVGAEGKLEWIGDDIIRKVFNEYVRKEVPVREDRRLSTATIQALTNLRSAPLVERNEAILRGILKGISASQMLGGGMAVQSHDTSYLGAFMDGKFEMSLLSLVLTYREKFINVSWYLATGQQGLISQDEAKALLNEVTKEGAIDERYAHVRIFSYSSGVGVGDIDHQMFDRVLLFTTSLGEDLAALGSGDVSDTSILLQSFDSKVAPHLSELVSRKVRDITKELSSSGKELVQTLYVMYNIGRVSTRDGLRQYHKRLFTKSKMTQQRFVAEIVELGFADEQGVELAPDIPRAHLKLREEYLKEGPLTKEEIERRFRSASQAVLDSAATFGLIAEENGKLTRHSLSDYERGLEKIIIRLKEDLQSEAVRTSEPGERVEWILQALERAKKEGRNYDAFVILTTLRDLGPTLQAAVSGIRETPVVPAATKTALVSGTTPSETSVEETAPPAAPSGEAPSRLVSGEKLPVEDKILEVLLGSPPLSLSEIEERLRNEGYGEDIKSSVFRLVISGRVKIASSA